MSRCFLIIKAYKNLIIDTSFWVHDKGRLPFQSSTTPVMWALSEESRIPICHEGEELKYLFGNSNDSDSFLIRHSNYKYDKYLIFFDNDLWKKQRTKHFCVDVAINSTSNNIIGTVAVTCHVSLHQKCNTSVCIRSCCNRNDHFDLKSKECVSNKNGPAITFKTSQDISIRHKSSRKGITTIYGPPTCDKFITLNYTGYINNGRFLLNNIFNCSSRYTHNIVPMTVIILSKNELSFI